MTTSCPFCNYGQEFRDQIVAENELCLFVRTNDPVLQGSGIIIPKAHRKTVFDITPDELTNTFALLTNVKRQIDKELAPDGYNIGWNCGSVAGQVVDHAHMHVIPRFADEPFAGKGIRHWLKSKANLRPPYMSAGIHFLK